MTEDKQAPSNSNAGYKILLGAGLANLGWGIFQWVDLIQARQGNKPACSFSKNLDCAAVWDGNFASTIHDITSIPVAGWGTIWGLMAVLLPILILKNDSHHLKAAARLVGLAAIGSIPFLAGASFSMGVFCLWCIITYVLVAGYAFVLHAKTAGGLFKDLGPGLPSAVGFLVLGVAIAWIPASKTPKNQAKAGLAALKEATQNKEEKPTKPDPKVPDGPDGPPTQQPKTRISKAEKDAQLASFLSQMPAEALQLISNFLADYNKNPRLPIKPTRDLYGAPDSPVLITDFTDARCGHCAQFVASLADFEYAAPAGTFKVEARHFPIDGNCNPTIPNRSEDALSCYAAKAQICFEGHPKSHEFTKLIFQNQQQLSIQAIQMLAKALAPEVNLASCVSTASTKQKLEDDIQYALEHEIDGTPMILVNGRKASSFAPFLFSIMMAEGDGKHPAFASLPAPKELPKDPHAGHKH